LRAGDRVVQLRLAGIDTLLNLGELSILELGDTRIEQDQQIGVLTLLRGSATHHLRLPIGGRQLGPQRLELG
jgi:hypothetical protein